MTADRSGWSKLRDLVASIRVAMMTTTDHEGNLTSRPMLALLREHDDAIWFMTQTGTEKLSEIAGDTRVNLAFVGSQGECVSVSGRVTVSRDVDVIEELWHPTYRAWFPEGKDDERLMLMRVTVDRADYWQAPTSRVVRIIGMATALVTGKPYETAERERIVSADPKR
jgi:general stress protein 26